MKQKELTKTFMMISNRKKLYGLNSVVRVKTAHRLNILYPANTGHCPCVGSMLAHRLRRWPNIEPTHGQCPVFAGYLPG